MKRKFLAAIAAVFPLIGCCGGKVINAEANSAPPYWSGIDSSGIVWVGEQCPVVVERETLTLSVPDLPKHEFNGEEYAAYASKVTAEYTFLNPESYDVSATLLFPYGNLPAYVGRGENPKSFSVTADGAPVECRMRHSYDSPDPFSIDEDMAALSNEKRTDTFYRDSLTVTPYTCSVNLPEDGFDFFRMTFDCNSKQTRILFPDGEGATYSLQVKNGYLTADYKFSDDARRAELHFYAVGEPVGVKETCLINNEKKSPSQASVATGEATTFGEFVLGQRDEHSAVNDIDYYNAYVAMLENEYSVSAAVSGCNLYEDYLLRWYEYELHIPANGRVVNSVTAPLYPSIDGDGNTRYEYTYLLSPAEKWADFQKIDIAIETPYYLSGSSLDFSKTENADGSFRYAFSRDALPLGELTFVLTEKPVPEYDLERFRKMILPPITWALFALLALALISALVTLIVVLSVKKKKRKK